MLVNLTAFHSALDTRLYVVGLPGSRASWQWAEWLPHCNVRGVGDDEDGGSAKQLDQLCFAPEKDKVSDFWKRVKRELDTRQVRMRDTSDEDKKAGGDVSLPLLVIVVDLLADMPADSPLKEVASEQVVALINSSGPTLGACIIFLAREPAQIPSDCVAMVEVASVGGRTVFRYTEVGLNTPRYIGDADVINAADARTKFASAIRRLDLRRSFGTDLPRAVDLLQMHTLMEGAQGGHGGQDQPQGELGVEHEAPELRVAERANRSAEHARSAHAHLLGQGRRRRRARHDCRHHRLRQVGVPANPDRRAWR